MADELGSRIRQEDRFDATLDAVLGVLPSYPQLGMAALLPHSTLKHSADAKTVLADDQPPARRRAARPTWTPAEAAVLLWELTSFHLWDNLVNDAQIPPDRYIEIITAAALSALGAPVSH